MSGLVIKCKHCGWPRGNHLAKLLNCPIGSKTRVGFIQFSQTTKFEPREPKVRK